MRSKIILGFALAASAFAQTSPFPGALDTPATLGVAADNVQSALTAPMTISDTTAQVANATRIPVWSIITFGSEQMKVCAKSGNTLTLGTPAACPSISGRGVSGTTTVAHSTGVIGHLNIDAYHQLAASSAIMAIEASIVPVLSVLSVAGFGADSTGSRDSGPAFLAAWNAAAATTGARLTIPCGTYKFLTPVVFTTAQQQSMLGSGSCTILNWAGSGGAAASMLLFPNCFACEVGNFFIDVNAPLNAAVQTANNGSGYTATMDVFRSIIIQARGLAATCFLLDGPVDGNNDQQRFVDDHCYGSTSASWQLGNASAGFNVLDVDMDHSSFSNAGFSQYGVWLRHGSFHWHDGDGGGNYGADFEVDTAGNDGVKIDNGEFENSKQFIHTLVGAGVSLTADVHDVTWDGGCLQQTQAQIKINCPGGPQPGAMMELGYPGPWVFYANRIGVSTHDVLATIQLDLDPSAFPASYTFIGNSFGTTAATNAALFSPLLPTKAFGNSLIGAGSTLTRLSPDLDNYPTTFAQPVTFSVFPDFGTLATTAWTPTLQFGGASTGISYAVSSGSYFKIGDLTFIGFNLTLTSKGSSIGIATIGGLPGSATFGGPVTTIPSNFIGLSVPMTPVILTGANYISLLDQDIGGGTGAGSLTNAQFTNTSNLYGYGWYK